METPSPPSVSGRKHVRPALRRRGRPVVGGKGKGEGGVGGGGASAPPVRSAVGSQSGMGGGRLGDGDGDGDGKNAGGEDLDALLASTMRRMAGVDMDRKDKAKMTTESALRSGGTDAGAGPRDGDPAAGGGGTAPSTSTSSPADRTKPAVAGGEAGTRPLIANAGAAKAKAKALTSEAPKGILRKPKYSSSGAVTGTGSRRAGSDREAAPKSKRASGGGSVVSSSSSAGAVPAETRRRTPRSTPALRGDVVERDVSSFFAPPAPSVSTTAANAVPSPPSMGGAADEVEGYRPATSAAAGVRPRPNGAERAGSNSGGNDRGAPSGKRATFAGGTKQGPNGPMILKSMGDLFNAGNAQGVADGPGNTVEADVSFACMTAEEYEETVELAREIEEGKEDDGDSESDLDADQDPNDACEGDLFDEAEAADHVVPVRDFDAPPELPPDAEVFMGRYDVFGPDDDGDDDSDSDRGGGGGSFFDFFGGPDDEADALPEPELGPFLRIWNPLTAWSTPSTGTLVRRWADEAMDPASAESGLMSCSDLPFDSSDLGASRCAGLMSMLRMHLPRALAEREGEGVKVEAHVQRGAEARLAALVRTFDYTEPMVNFNSDMWKVLTSALLEISSPCLGQAEGRDDCGRVGGMPKSAKEVGFKEEEWRYLTKTAILSLNPINQ